MEQATLAASQSAIMFAQTAIKSISLLNGGGLIFLPAFVGLFDLLIGGPVIAVAIFFFVGLCLSMVANVAAFHAMDNEGLRLVARREEVVTKLNVEHNPKGNPPEEAEKKLKKFAKDQETAGDLVKEHRDRGQRCIYGSFGFFMLGAVALLLAMVI